MTTEQLDNLKRLAQAATPGPWYSRGQFVRRGPSGGMGEHMHSNHVANAAHKEDAAFITACSPDVVLELLAERADFSLRMGHAAKAHGVALVEMDALRERVAELEAELAKRDHEHECMLGWLEAENAATESGESVADCIERGDHIDERGDT